VPTSGLTCLSHEALLGDGNLLIKAVSSGELLVAGQRFGEGEECGEQPGGALVREGQPVSHVSKRSTTQRWRPTRMLVSTPLPGDAQGDSPSLQPGPQMRMATVLVAVQPGRPAPRSAAQRQAAVLASATASQAQPSLRNATCTTNEHLSLLA
jgi:hypothetical protein